MEKNNKKSFLKSKFFLCSFTFMIGAVIMYYLVSINEKDVIAKNIVHENIKTTTIEEESDLKKAISNVYESTVYIEVYGNSGPISSGSGFVYKNIDNTNYILTNYHVIQDGTKFVVTFTDGEENDAILVNGDEYYDIAVLKINSKDVKKVATFGDSTNLELGDTVFTVGAPLGKKYMGTITKGIISGINRMITVKLSSGSYSMEVIQTDASINSGNSGGAICNIKGEVIGITSSKLVGNGVEGMGFAIPINSVLSIIDDIESGKKIERPYLGIQLVDLENAFALKYYYGINISSTASFGAVLSYIEKDSPADKAGLNVGDIIIEMDGVKIEDVTSFKYELYKHSIKDKIKIKYYRDNKINDVTIELTKSIKN